MKRISSSALAGMILVLTGCAAKSPESMKGELGIDLPATWVERETARPVPDTWWVTRFDSSGLTDTVQAALLRNRSLKAAAARVRAADAQVVIAGSSLYPMVTGNFDASRSQRNFIGFPFSRGGAGGGAGAEGEESEASEAEEISGQAMQEVVQSNLSNSFGLSLDVSWEVDIWGRVRAGQSAAIGELEATVADFNAAQLSIAAQTAKIWFSIIATREQLELAREAARIFRESQDTIERGIRLQGGDAAQLYLAQSDVATAEAAVAQNEEQLMRLRKQLDVLIGEYPAGERIAASRLPSLPPPPPAGIPAEVLDRRPDLRGAERRLAASDKRVLEARRSLLPRISLTGSVGTSTEDLSEILNSDYLVWTLAGGITQPIFQGGQLRQTIRVREAEFEIQLADFQEAALIAFREVEEALAADRFLAVREAALRRAVSISESALEQAREDYVGGTGDVLTLLRAQQTLINSRSALIEVRRLRLENRVDLHVALGGSFSPRTDKTVVIEE